jgi:hypothetical protein
MGSRRGKIQEGVRENGAGKFDTMFNNLGVFT